MKNKILVFLLSIISICCDKPATKQANEKYDEINQIVLAIISQDSLNVYRNSKSSDQICNELKRVLIEIPVKQRNGSIYPAAWGNIYITDLLTQKIGNETFFKKEDSLTLIKQNSSPKKINIHHKILDRLASTTREKEKEKSKIGAKYGYYEMSIPLFSKDGKKAYVELGYYCGGLCGNGKSFQLEKVSGNWKIINEWETWMS
ncbi:hypothetical protein HUK80_13375 [Flavobacterium sp. MAH-1]|uniref:Uncharacterized protein n=1 Tax=Flavobacterium agri TaxID=2743471 RepID=A0A7Y9C7Y3_9FLAO|nr:hypothetical protein [Flavobacterium agri]NUY81889.1 hypothetical protein [Flavobacterium agri]NYA71913.1 hypothetical protein [Flavobacterium agri]